MSGLRAVVSRHPYLAAWLALAVVMVAILLFAAKDVGLQASHMAALTVATVLLAGGCVWIISWE
ncbi:MAG: hypothetical protein M1401_10275 [Chloroflexi bacterium]|nr:hypothetical protein [Chloroflexota bacterium]